MLQLSDIKTMPPSQRQAERESILKSIAPQLARLQSLADFDEIALGMRIECPVDLTLPYPPTLTVLSIPQPNASELSHGHRLDFQLGL
jgi:hypothetical protein